MSDVVVQWYCSTRLLLKGLVIVLLFIDHVGVGDDLGCVISETVTTDCY